MLVISNVLLWAIMALLVVTVLALARQIGVLHERIAPMGALVTDHGPSAGQPAPRLEAMTLQGDALTIGAPTKSARPDLLLFVAPGCPVCKKIIPIAKTVARNEDLRLVFIGDGEIEAQRKMLRLYDLASYPFANGPQIGQAFRIGKLPYAVLIGGDGVIVAKGLVNTREHLESLVVAQETGFASAQAFLREQAGPTTAASH